jgi:phosphate transport system substrate-binding protein
MSQKNDAPALVVSLLITLGLIGGGFWWLSHSKNPIPSPTTAAPTDASGSIATQPTASSFANVQNVPSGLFSYGGSTSWAPVRGQVDPAIQAAWKDFQLRYTQPATGTPGSAMGIRMLLDNQLSIAQSSRSLKPEEYQAAKTRGFTLKEVPVALEGIAIAVNPGLSIPGLTIEQLKGIYTGQITNWNQVGGADLAIVPYSRRPEDGGTVEFFSENVLGGGNFGSAVQYVNTTTQALQAVAANPGAIYYASAPEVLTQCSIKPLAIGRQAGTLIPPYREPLVTGAQCGSQHNQLNADALKTGQYPLTRRLFVIVKQNGQADQQAGEAYANLLLSEQGQTLLSQAGFVRIR